MFFRTFTVLMCKHFMTRLRQFIATAIECVVPILPFVIVYLVREILFATIPKLPFSEKPPALQLRNSDGPPCVLYTPETKFTRLLMKLVGKKLNLPRLTKLDKKRLTRGYYPFDNASTVFTYTANVMGTDEAIVEFHDVSWNRPETLNYTIRMKPVDEKEFFTSTTSTVYDIMLWPRERWEHYDDSRRFIKLQWAIDTSFIEMLSGKEVTQRFTVQQFSDLGFFSKLRANVKIKLLFISSNIAILPVFFTLMLRLIVEKGSGIQELMKMSGVTSRTLVFTHVLNVLIPGTVYYIGVPILMKKEPTAVLAKSSLFLICLGLFLHFLYTVTVALVCSFLAKLVSPTASTVLSLYIILTLPSHILSTKDTSNYTVWYGLIPYVPLIWFIKEICLLEATGVGLTYTTMMKSHNPKTASVAVAYQFFALSILICLVLVWYFDKVVPSQHGLRYPWYFIFQKSYWIAPSASVIKLSDIRPEQPEYYEEPRSDLEPGIEIINVTKGFWCGARALDNVSVNIYKGEITVLLGHNGSGKSALMNVITGMTNFSKGSVLVQGINVKWQRMRAVRNIALCPEQYVLFDDISVLEHIMFFTLLDRGSFVEAWRSSKELLRLLNLTDKAYSNISTLSGGMKKRTQLACTFAADANVLVLDEPTSGLDVETRRAVWDYLLSLRANHTILLATHTMEEADALGDRVVALHTGRVLCHATPMYLKRVLDTGYRLTFTTYGVPYESSITRTILSVVPEVTIKDESFNSLSYNLPIAYTKSFPKLFQKLEMMKDDLDIESIGVGTPSLEQVFLKLYSDVMKPLDEIEDEREPVRLWGPLSWPIHIIALIKRYILFMWVYKSCQVVCGIVPVVLLILYVTDYLNDGSSKTRRLSSGPITTLNLDMYGLFDMYGLSDMSGLSDLNEISPDYRVLYNVNGTESDLRPISDQYPNVFFENTSDVAVLRNARRSNQGNSVYLAGIELNDTDAKVMYTPTVDHTAPVALNLLSNLVATRTVPWASGRTITTHTYPLFGPYSRRFQIFGFTIFVLPKNLIYVYLWVFCVTILLLSGFTIMAHLPCKDSLGPRHMHLLAGCCPEIHWFTMFLVMTLQVLIIYVSIVKIACTYFDYDRTFTEPKFIEATGVVVLLGGMSMISFSFLLSIFFKQNVVVGINSAFIGFAMIFPIAKRLAPKLAKLEKYALKMLPAYTFSQGMYNCGDTAFWNALCQLNRNRLCPFLSLLSRFVGDSCCRSEAIPWCFYCYRKGAPGTEIYYLSLQIVVYLACLLVFQRGAFTMLIERIVNITYRRPPLQCREEENVSDEREYVQKALTMRGKPKEKEHSCCWPDDILLVADVHKNYLGVFGCSKALRGVTFGVRRGECFGFLGLNGAGKTTMYQVLAAETCPTRGCVYANSKLLTFPFCTGYLHSYGYCPQFWQLDDFLTGRQTIKLLLYLNGLIPCAICKQARAWINLVGLEKYANKLVSSYSAGCLRRLATATALCLRAPISLLDEPTVGVDVVARRRIWTAFRRVIYERRAIFITSHSLDEMEALCDRIAILVAGEICALDSPAALRADYAVGHTVIMRVKHESDIPVNEKTGRPERHLDVEELKATMKRKFICTIKDEHKTMLHYHIDTTMKYSKLFRDMEYLQSTFPGLLEDYSVSETTLEEVFLSFAQKGREEKKKPSAEPDLA